MAARQVEPYRQGRLDGLCGVYALINALRLLCPRLDEDACAGRHRNRPQRPSRRSAPAQRLKPRSHQMPHTSLRLSDPAHHEQPCLRRFVCAPTCTFDTEEFSALDRVVTPGWDAATKLRHKWGAACELATHVPQEGRP